MHRLQKLAQWVNSDTFRPGIYFIFVAGHKRFCLDEIYIWLLEQRAHERVVHPNISVSLSTDADSGKIHKDKPNFEQKRREELKSCMYLMQFTTRKILIRSEKSTRHPRNRKYRPQASCTGLLQRITQSFQLWMR